MATLQKYHVYGFYSNFPVSIIVDPHSEFSHVALRFAVANDIPRTVRRGRASVAHQSVRGPVTVPTKTGQYESEFVMYISSVQMYDVLLGRDWISACTFHVHNGIILDPNPLSVLGNGHRWCLREIAPGTVSARAHASHASVTATGTGSVDGSLSYHDPEEGPSSSGARPCGFDHENVVGSSMAVLVEDSGPSTTPHSLDMEMSADSLHSSLFFKWNIAQLRCHLTSHGIDHSETPHTVKDLRDALIVHLSQGQCAANSEMASCPSCTVVARRYVLGPDCVLDTDGLRYSYLKRASIALTIKPLRALMQSLRIEHPEKGTRAELRAVLKAYLREMRKGKSRTDRLVRFRRGVEEGRQHVEALREEISGTWPRVVTQSLKDRVVSMFREATSSDALRTFTCACCAEAASLHQKVEMDVSELCLDVLRCPEDIMHSDFPPQLPYTEGPLAGVLLDPRGVCDGAETILLCKECSSALKRETLPPLALANRTYVGPVPDELKGLTPVEEVMIARCRAKCCIVRLGNEGVSGARTMANMQRGLKGNIIEYPQRPDRLATILPRPVSEVTSIICVIFVGSNPPTKEWLLSKAKPLAVRKDRVRRALLWLKRHNPMYRDVEIDEDELNALPDNGVLPYHVETVDRGEDADALLSRYDSYSPSEPRDSRNSEDLRDFDERDDESENERNNGEGERGIDQNESSGASRAGPERDVLFQNVVISDVDGNAPAKELRAAALRHFKDKGGGYVEIPHDPIPVNEFCNPELFPMMFPTLFPYGIGGLEDSMRCQPISLKRHLKHLFNLSDKRFQEHSSFLFIVFNILQRREVLLRSSLKVKKQSFARVAQELQTVSAAAIRRVCERMSTDEKLTALDDEERRVLKLMKQVNLVTSNVPGSSSSKLVMRNQIRAMMLQMGLPSFFITINPADVFNPVVKFLAGENIDVDRLTPDQVPRSWDQGILVARNPFVAARFFNLYLNAFFSSLLGYDLKKRTYMEEGGILGHVKGYYGCVEAQGRGSLHCHMLVWLEGGLNPNEIRDRVIGGDIEFGRRLISFLDDTISNCIPEDDGANPLQRGRVHPCAIRGVDGDLPDDVRRLAEREDLRLLIKECQVHKHGTTCYKYSKPNEKQECRFDLDPANVCPESSFDAQTGDLCLRCLDGMVNNFNGTILQAMRCNMDIKFIGSGEAAKAILYYVTNYITKSQLKAHVAYAALELAISRLSVVEEEDDDELTRGKRLLRSCAFALLTHQEMSAQQVALYLLGHEERYVSHEFNNLYWVSFEAYLDKLCPSPECYPSVSIASAEPSPQLSASQLSARNISGENGVSVHDTASVISSDDDGESLFDSDSDASSEGSPTDEEDLDQPPFEQHDLEFPAEDEIRLGLDEGGNVVPTADQVCDYIFRAPELSNMTIWQFVCRLRKERISKKRRTTTMDIVDEVQIEEPDSDDGSGDEPLTAEELCDLLRDEGRQRPTYQFMAAHPEAKRMHSRIGLPSSAAVAVPIGPALPRRDNPSTYEKYCRVMLMLFRPWRRVSDLRGDDETWSAAFEAFRGRCGTEILKILDNMQILHECKDNGGDHFRVRAHLRKLRIVMDNESSTVIPSDLSDEMEDEDILVHLEECGRLQVSRHDGPSNEQACVSAALAHNLYGGRNDITSSLECGETDMCCDEVDSIELEKRWAAFYENRKAILKRKTAVDSEADGTSADNMDIDAEVPRIRTLEDARESRYDGTSIDANPHLRVGAAESLRKAAEDISETIQKWTLNAEQAHAFRLIAMHAAREKADLDPLRMFLGGPGGTGKSRVINALRDFFQIRGENRRFRLASFTGIAAANVGGITLHTSLCLNQGSGSIKVGSKTHQDLIAMWEGVDFLFIDEISMVGCFLLARVSEALSLATGSKEPFGGVNVIFAGDFAQLPPVGESRLYGYVKPSAGKGSANSKANRTIFGKLLWLSVDVVVLLSQPMRQAGNENQPFVELLSRLRVGRCTAQDHSLLHTRLLGRVDRLSRWSDAPVIVYDNATKDALNVKAVEAYAQRTGRNLHWYYCTDRHRGRVITNGDIRQLIMQHHSGKTKGLLGRIPLVLGMKVIISKNFDLEGGVLNGTVGTLRRIRYRVNENSERSLVSCVVRVSSGDPPAMPGLGDHEVAVLEESKVWDLEHPISKKTLKLNRTQVAIQPAYAFTSHRAQGQTFDRIVIDLESCCSSESAYVMLSRARSLEGVAIMRPFSIRRISTVPNKQLTDEMTRLEMLWRRTREYAVDGDRPEVRMSVLTTRIQDLPMDGDENESLTQRRAGLLRDVAGEIADSVRQIASSSRAGTSGSARRKRSNRDDIGRERQRVRRD